MEVELWQQILTGAGVSAGKMFLGAVAEHPALRRFKLTYCHACLPLPWPTLWRRRRPMGTGFAGSTMWKATASSCGLAG